MPDAAAVLTAQELRSGTIVYWQGDGWSSALATAHVARDPGDRAVLEALAADANAGTELIDSYVLEVGADGVPRRCRDAWREAGPSIAFGADAA